MVINFNTPNTDNGANSGSISGNIKNLPTIANLAKYKKYDLLKANFAKINSFETDFFPVIAQKAFIYL